MIINNEKSLVMTDLKFDVCHKQFMKYYQDRAVLKLRIAIFGRRNGDSARLST